MSDEVLREFLPARPAVSHKGTFGKLLNISGSAFYTGAALLSTNAALRMGVGLCTLATPARVINAIAPAVPETTYLPLEQDFDGFIDDKAVDMLMIELENKKYDALLMGCGLGDRKATADLTEIVIRSADCPVILDADGLNAVSLNINILRKASCPIIVTPHEREFIRMGGDLSGGRLAGALKFAAKYNCIVVLKGSGTITALPNGTAFVNTTGNPGMAKGGSGDILAGMIASLIGQKFPAAQAAAYGVFIHGLTGDICKKNLTEYAMTPTDMLDATAEAFRIITRK